MPGADHDRRGGNVFMTGRPQFAEHIGGVEQKRLHLLRLETIKLINGVQQLNDEIVPALVISRSNGDLVSLCAERRMNKGTKEAPGAPFLCALGARRRCQSLAKRRSPSQGAAGDDRYTQCTDCRRTLAGANIRRANSDSQIGPGVARPPLETVSRRDLLSWTRAAGCNRESEEGDSLWH